MIIPLLSTIGLTVTALVLSAVIILFFFMAYVSIMEHRSKLSWFVAVITVLLFLSLGASFWFVWNHSVSPENFILVPMSGGFFAVIGVSVLLLCHRGTLGEKEPGENTPESSPEINGILDGEND